MDQEYGCFSPTNCPKCKWYPKPNGGYWGKGDGRVDLLQAPYTINVGCDDHRFNLSSIFGKKGKEVRANERQKK